MLSFACADGSSEIAVSELVAFRFKGPACQVVPQPDTMAI